MKRVCVCLWLCVRDFDHGCTAGNIQWFYFSVTNARRGLTVRFNLVNHNKPDSLFNYGLLPAVYSTADAASDGRSWRRSGTNACYYRSHNWYESGRKRAKKASKKGGKTKSKRRDDDSDDDDGDGGGAGSDWASGADDAPVSPKFYFIASFTYTFTNDGNDVVYFAYCQPYTASRLQRVLRVRLRRACQLTLHIDARPAHELPWRRGT